MEARPFRLVGASDRAAIDKALNGHIEAWALAWFRHAPDVRLELEVEPGTTSEWLIFGELPDRWIAWRQDSAARKGLLRQILGLDSGASSTPGVLSEAALSDCIADFAERCLAAAGMVCVSPATTCDFASLPHGYGSGTEFARLSNDGAEHTFALGGAVGEALATPSRPTAKAGPLQPRTAAIGNGTVQLEITLGDAELSLAELASIAVGDVISLDASPRDPISVRTSDGQAAFHAYLGRNTERKVIQVSGK